MKRWIAALLIGVFGLALVAGCKSQADTASDNLSTAADNFEIARRITVVNGITDTQLLVIEGYCSLGNNDPARELSITCKDKDGYQGAKKYFITLSDNVIVLTEQLQSAKVSTDHSRVIWRPSTLIPGIEVQ